MDGGLQSSFCFFKVDSNLPSGLYHFAIGPTSIFPMAHECIVGFQVIKRNITHHVVFPVLDAPPADLLHGGVSYDMTVGPFH